MRNAPRHMTRCRSHGPKAIKLLPMNVVEDLIVQLEATTEQLATLLRAVQDQDWRPADGRWSFRDVAAHMEACQTECVLVRVRQMAFGAKQPWIGRPGLRSSVARQLPGCTVSSLNPAIRSR